MCRLLAYSGDPIFLEEFVCKPQHSLVRQSMQADESKWRPTVMDSASAGTPVTTGTLRRAFTAKSCPRGQMRTCSRCAPLCALRYSLHTFAPPLARPWRAKTAIRIASITTFLCATVKSVITRKCAVSLRLLPDDLYAARKGATDSELMFLLAMAHVQRGATPIEAVREMLTEVRASMNKRGVRAPLRFTRSALRRPASVCVSLCERRQTAESLLESVRPRNGRRVRAAARSNE